MNDDRQDEAKQAARQAALDYQKAADSYETYLKQHPTGKHAYEYSYYLAESLFYGQKYPEAAAAYERCRATLLATGIPAYCLPGNHDEPAAMTRWTPHAP